MRAVVADMNFQIFIKSKVIILASQNQWNILGVRWIILLWHENSKFIQRPDYPKTRWFCR
jgi:hypothetical protein